MSERERDGERAEGKIPDPGVHLVSEMIHSHRLITDCICSTLSEKKKTRY